MLQVNPTPQRAPVPRLVRGWGLGAPRLRISGCFSLTRTKVSATLMFECLHPKISCGVAPYSLKWLLRKGGVLHSVSHRRRGPCVVDSVVTECERLLPKVITILLCVKKRHACNFTIACGDVDAKLSILAEIGAV